ncbi:MAG: AMIN domain-containing protein [Terriglobales bacterium]
MKAIRKHLAVWILVVSGATAQSTAGTATVQNVTVARDGSGLSVEVTLSSPVQPSVETAVNPDRILLDLPGTITRGSTQKAVNTDGVRRIRMGQHSTTPPVTRVVLDLDQAHPYTMKAEGNRIILTVGPALNANAGRSAAPAPPVSLGLSGIFRRKPAAPQPPTADQSASLPLPDSAPVAVSIPASHPADAKDPTASPAPPFSGTQAAADSKPHDSSVATGGFPSASVDAASTTAKAVVNGTQFDEKANGTDAPSDKAVEVKSGDAAEAASAEPAAAKPAAAIGGAAMMLVRSDDPSLRTVFRVKYVAEGVAYIEGGRAQGLAEGMKLEVKDTNLPARQGDSVSAEDPQVVAELEVSGIAETSAVTEIHTPKRPVKAGDLAYLSSGDAEALVAQRALSSTRQYPAVISFSEGDTLDEEAREEVPRPPLPSVNRARGRIGLDYITTMSQGMSSMSSTNLGFAFRGDITRIGGTYWNLSGYYRGRFTSQNATGVQTIQDLINHTYHLNMTYDNPNSSLVAGFGRLYLPWAASLDTIDGGYFGKRLTKGTTLGIFGGSTPDPTSWNYSPNRVIGGGFLNFDGGSYEAWHYSSTSGAGISMVNWTMNRPFVFFEDTVSYSRRFAVYEAAQFDSPAGSTQTPAPGPGLGRSFLTVRVQAHPRVELDFNHNYFRDVPTYDPSLIGTGLLDKFLFQGFSAGARVEVAKQVFLSTTFGRSNRSGDTSSSLNQMFGVTFNRLPLLQLRASASYARFNSSFGSGSYESISVSRQMSENLRLEFLAGQQDFSSAVTTANRSRFLTSTWETNLGPHYYIQGNFTVNRGQMNYEQWLFSIGYRFDSKNKARQ